MDPTLKSYLDDMRKDSAEIKLSISANGDKISSLAQRFESQTAQIAELRGWKPDLEARFTQLQTTVNELQRAQSSSAAAAGESVAAHLATRPPSSSEAVPGQGLGVNTFPGGNPTAAFASPSAPPVTGMVSLQHPMFPTSDPQLMSKIGRASCRERVYVLV